MRRPGGVGRAFRSWLRLEILFAFAIATALARQALWLLPGTAVPITLATAAGFAAALVVRRSAAGRPAPPRIFWLIVALPVVAVWALRAPFPDLGYDVLNYHLMHGQKALLGPVFSSGDFYPYSFPFLNPAGDMVTALFRMALGYRAGTIANALAVLWAGEVLWRLLTPTVRGERARAAAVLVVIASEGVLWEVSGYMVDLLALPVLLEATRMAATDRRDADGLPRRSAVLGLLLGTVVALKLTNLVFALPIALVALARWLRPRGEKASLLAIAGACLAGLAAFAVPVAPHALLLLWKTGNPVFPYFNELFASPYFPAWNIKDGRWGPGSPTEAVVWPLLAAFHPARLSELAATSGRLALGWCGALAALVFFRRDARLRALSVIVLLGGLLWSLGSGYHRYGLFCELLGGLLLVLLGVRLAGQGDVVGEETGRHAAPSSLRAAAALVALAAATQSATAIYLTVRSDWSWRPTVFRSPREFAREASLFFRDYDLPEFLPAETRKLIPPSPVWVDVVPKVNGIMTLLDPRASMICLQVRELLESQANRDQLDGALRLSSGRRAVSLAFDNDADHAENRLFQLGFPAVSRRPLAFPFFSERRRLALVAFEIDLPPPLSARAKDAKPIAGKPDEPLWGSMDGPVEGQRVVGDLLVRGWAREPGEDFLVTILVDGSAVEPRTFRRVPRGDVAAVLPWMGDCRWAGYEAVVPRRAGSAVERTVSVFFRSRGGRTRHYPGVKVRWTEAPARSPESRSRSLADPAATGAR